MKVISVDDFQTLEQLKTYIIRTDDLRQLPDERLKAFYDFCLLNFDHVTVDVDPESKVRYQHHYCQHNFKRICRVAAERYFKVEYRNAGAHLQAPA